MGTKVELKVLLSRSFHQDKRAFPQLNAEEVRFELGVPQNRCFISWKIDL